LYFLAFFAAQVFGGMLAAGIAPPLLGIGYDFSGGIPITILAIAAVCSLVTGTLVLIHIGWTYRRDLLFRTGLDGIGLAFGSRRQNLWAALFAVLLCVAFLNLCERIQPNPKWTPGPLVTMAYDTGWPRYAWLFLLLLAGPTEEFFYRGVLLRGLSTSWGPLMGGIIVTLLFSALHLFETYGYWVATGAIVVLAVTTLIVRIRTGCLGPAITFHTTYNVGVAIAWLSDIWAQVPVE
jgi:membrane protease YdiL (CAAX protease family)